MLMSSQILLSCWTLDWRQELIGDKIRVSMIDHSQEPSEGKFIQERPGLESCCFKLLPK